MTIASGAVGTLALTHSKEVQAFFPLVIGGVYLSSEIVALLGLTTLTATGALAVNQTLDILEDRETGNWHWGQNGRALNNPVVQNWQKQKLQSHPNVTWQGGFQPAPPPLPPAGYQGERREPWNTGNQHQHNQQPNHTGHGQNTQPQQPSFTHTPAKAPSVEGDIIMNREMENIEERADEYGISFERQLDKSIYYLEDPRSGHSVAFIVIDENGRVDNMRVNNDQRRKGLGSVLVHILNTDYDIIPTVTRSSILNGAHEFWNTLANYGKINLIEDR